MLDIRKIRENPDYYIAETEKKYTTVSLKDVLAVDTERRPLLTEVEKLKSERNAESKRIGELKKKGENADEAVKAMRDLGDKIDGLDKKLKELDYKQTEMLMHVPNIAPQAPEGKDSSDNVVEKDGPIPFDFYAKNRDFQAVDHKTLGERLGIFDFERGAKISGNGFPVYRGLGSRLERALIQWFLDEHMANGFEEFTPPYLVSRNTMRGTGQLPKFEEDMYRCDKDDDLFLIPTAEVPLTNLYSNEVIPADQLPKRICAYSACFRREAGSYGKDTRGLLRLHQFNKVEMVYFSRPDNSYEMHEELTRFGESLLEKLELPYHRLCLCKGDLGFGAAKCYDLEVYAPVEQKWLEVSSCSNFEDFQARRAGIKTKIDGKNVFVHTLNGSGLATPRVMVGICDNYQQKDGSLLIPKVLRPYMGGLEVIEPKK
ncbi:MULTISPECIES: serine--tRNA ligase [Fibrobacter]|uniref:Serine--tRNA ligase n=1 Tax=Fibrobacter intestinalis TaxID=28122 RepID=A0A1M6SW56_9BACT|nr:MULTISPECIES: serine--tRNA ligase [Fibrobacter]MDD7298946.1 serine--tRNA ligase [Fibrobacter intestinalis]PBC68590.1 seryl-tRNA synthetase [Fibrobacter sp. UWS1]SHK48880.1 seryl-tRNA synthetase [Fibrobacter intestinalis]